MRRGVESAEENCVARGTVCIVFQGVVVGSPGFYVRQIFTLHSMLVVVVVLGGVRGWIYVRYSPVGYS